GQARNYARRSPLHLAKKAGLPMEAAKARIRYECQTRRMLMFNRPEGSYHPELIGTHRIDFGRLPLGSSGLLLLIDEVDGLAQLVKEELPSKGKNRISDSDQLLAVMVE